MFVNLATIAMSLTVLPLGSTALAINNGEPDDANAFPNVGAIVIDTDLIGAIQFCSGTLIDDRAFLTAGHCTDGVASLTDVLGFTTDDVYVSFDPVDALNPATWLDVEATSTNPDYDPRTLFNDVGLLILEEEVGIAPAALAPVGYLDELFASKTLSRNSDFAIVGYGSTRPFPGKPQFLPNDGQRRFATAEFQNLNFNWLQLNQVQAPGVDNGGGCFGDSGGPIFWTTDDGSSVLSSISSWGDATCTAASKTQRVDMANVQDYIATELTAFSAPSSIASVPEPSGCSLVLLAASVLSALRRRRSPGTSKRDCTWPIDKRGGCEYRR